MTVNLLLFAYVLGIVPALLIGGPLSDRFGWRPLMLPAPLLAAAGSVILAIGAQSAAVLAIGRVFSGVALGLAMAVGGSWLKELSSPPWGDGSAGARRAAMSLTAGFGIGAGAAGVLAQWGPAPSTLSYACNAALSLVAAVALGAAPETRQRAGRSSPGGWWTDLAIPVAARRRFLFVVLPIAPWVFGAAGSAYAVLPALMAGDAGGMPIAFSALLCVVTLGVGFAVQQAGRHLGADGVRGVVTALLLLVVGMGAAAWAAATLTVAAALIAAAVLGAGYGMALLVGLQEIQRLAGPDDLAGLTAVFYSVSYLGFAIPAVLAFVAGSGTTYSTMFGAATVAALGCLVVTLAGSSRP